MTQQTSIEAYQSYKNSGKLNKAQIRTLNTIRFYTGNGITPNFKDIIKVTGNRNDRKRLSELEVMGAIKKVGVIDGCSSYQFVRNPAEREFLRQYHQRKKPELVQFLEWAYEHKIRRCPGGWQIKLGDKHPVFTNKQLIKQFRQAKKLIESQQLIW